MWPTLRICWPTYCYFNILLLEHFYESLTCLKKISERTSVCKSILLYVLTLFINVIVLRLYLKKVIIQLYFEMAYFKVSC